MLEGIIRYRDKDMGVVEYAVQAKDSFQDLKLRLDSNDIAVRVAINNIEGSKDSEEVEPEFRITYGVQEDGIQGRSVRMSVYDKVYTDDGGYDVEEIVLSEVERTGWNAIDEGKRGIDIPKTNRYKTNIPNTEFATRVAALIRYASVNGTKNYNQNVIGQDFSSDREVTITVEETGEELGTIYYTMGLITGMSLKNEYLEIKLQEVSDDGSIEAIFQTLKEEDRWKNRISPTPVRNVGFKYTRDNLGFEYTPTVAKEGVQAFGAYNTIEEVIDAHPEKDSSWIMGRQYEIVSDENLESVIEEFLTHDGLIAYDTETTGLDITFKSRTNEADQLVGVVLSKEIGTGYYFPLQHKLFDNLCGGDHHYFMERYMRELLETKEIICHNLSYDWKVSHIYDINVNCVFDTMLAFGVTYGYKEPTYRIGLSSLVKNLFGLDMFDLGDFVIGGDFRNSEIKFWDLSYELVRQYAPVDADMTLSLYEYLNKHDVLNEFGANKILEMEVEFSKAVAYSEFYGYKIPVERIPELEEEIIGGMEREHAKMEEIAGEEFNPNSPQQLGSIMYGADKLNIPPVDERKSTDKDTLKVLSREYEADGSLKYPFVKHLANYRTHAGIFKNFLKRLPEFSTDDGYIFARVMQLGTTTGRCSVNNPNYQSYNDAVKKYIVPRPGYITMDSDFSQIEYRVLASLANQSQLIEAFNDPDLDYHTYQASRMFSTPYALVTPGLREQSKGVNFGLPYGMADPSLGKNVFGEMTAENTRKAAELRRRFFEGQEKIEEFFERTRDFGVREGYTVTHFGRRRYYDRGRFNEGAIRRQAGNHVIQGSAADIYKIGVIQMFQRIVEEDWLGKVLINAFVHDEILMEVHESIDPYEFIRVWREEFEVRVAGFCRLFAGLGVGACWYDAKNNDFPPQYLDEIVAKSEDESRVWDGNHSKFIEEIYSDYEDYKTKRVYDYIHDETEKGEIIKPALGSLLIGEVHKVVEAIQQEDKDLQEELQIDYLVYIEETEEKQAARLLQRELQEELDGIESLAARNTEELNRKREDLTEAVDKLVGREKVGKAVEGQAEIDELEREYTKEIEQLRVKYNFRKREKAEEIKELNKQAQSKASHMVEGIQEEFKEKSHVRAYNKMLGINLIPMTGPIPREVDGAVNEELMDIQNQLKIFCKRHGIDYDKECEIESASSYAQKQEEQKHEGMGELGSYEYPIVEEISIDPEKQRILVLQNFGYNVDEENHILHLAETYFYTREGVERGTKRLRERGLFTKASDVMDTEGKKKVRGKVYAIQYYPEVRKRGDFSQVIGDMLVTEEDMDLLVGMYGAWVQSKRGVIA